jgi:hypothetical protein
MKENFRSESPLLPVGRSDAERQAESKIVAESQNDPRSEDAWDAVPMLG